MGVSLVAIAALAFIGSGGRSLMGRGAQWALVVALLCVATALGAVVEPMARVPLAVSVVCLLAWTAATTLARADADETRPGSAFR